ncbi:uncharacterized protein LOC107039682 [Diachasma alloeum]|uniref:uncharacterized protein LOC107039682 n=1 Tax=Diachasma alloeum TaxID=454923 RepID=UPI000738186E|nr:uncharacterized protein LOC107039682 [Diachasma alloeum]
MSRFVVFLFVTSLVAAVTPQQGMQIPPVMGGMSVGQYDGMGGGIQSGRGGAMMGSYGAKEEQGGNMGGMNDMRQMGGTGRMRRVSEDDLKKSNKENPQVLNEKAIKSERDKLSAERNDTTKNDTAHAAIQGSGIERLNDTLPNDNNGRQMEVANGKENNTTDSNGQQTTGSPRRHRRQTTGNSKEIGTLGYGGDYGDDWGHGGHGGHGCDDKWDYGHGSWSSRKQESSKKI